jgi:hypothetical protein
VGRLLVSQWDKTPDSGGRPQFQILAEGAATTFMTASDGPLFLKINNRPANLSVSDGQLAVDIVSVDD